MGNIDILKKYYKEVCTPLIFVNETSLEELRNVKVYLYDFNKQQELENFKKVFQEYMAMYVRNEDIINLYDLSQDIAEQLKKEFKKYDKTFWYLYNFIYSKNEFSKQWLKWIGFKFDNPKPAGMNIPDGFEFFYRVKEIKGLTIF